mgnify:CR=1 FL=1
MAKTHMTMKANGAEVEGLVETRTLLGHFIRETLQRTVADIVATPKSIGDRLSKILGSP